MKPKNDTDVYGNAIKRPIEHETPNAYKRWKIRERRWILAIWLVILVVIVLVVTRASAAADWLCDYVEALTVYPQVHLTEWIGYPEGWKDMPNDLGQDIMLPISEDGEQFYLLRSSASAGETWLWTYRSMRSWTDAAGDHDGHHDFCPAVLVIDT